MISLFRHVLLCFVLAATLISCGTQEDTAEQTTWEIIASLPGIHLTMATESVPGFADVTQEEITVRTGNGEDIWLYTPTDGLTPPSSGDQLQVWLDANGAIPIPLFDGAIHWIPADPEMEPLGYLEAAGLAAAMDPGQRAILLYERGNSLRTDRDFAQAIESYQAAIELDAQYGEPYIGLGAAYLGIGHNEDAIRVLRKGTKLLQDDYWGYRLLGNAYLNLSRYALAADALTQAYLLDAGDPHLLIGIALAQGRSGQQTLALKTLEQLRNRSDDAELLSAGEVLQAEFDDAGAE